LKRKEIPERTEDLKRIRSQSSKNSLGNNYQSTSTSTSSPCANSKAWNFGRPTYKCKHYDALLRCEERLNSKRGTKEPSFGICCKKGNIYLPPQKVPPPYLANLLNSEGQDPSELQTKYQGIQLNVLIHIDGRICG
jgi:hypothetical protein